MVRGLLIVRSPHQSFSGQRIGQRPEIGRRRGAELHPFTKDGVKESKRRSVQSMSFFRRIIPIKSGSLFDRPVRPVVFVADDRMANVRQVDSNLMIAP